MLPRDHVNDRNRRQKYNQHKERCHTEVINFFACLFALTSKDTLQNFPISLFFQMILMKRVYGDYKDVSSHKVVA